MTPSAQEIQDWLRDRLSRLTDVAPEAIDPAEPMLRYGLDSVAVVALVTDLESWLGYRFRENPLPDHPTIAALAHFLAEQVAQGRSK